MPDITNYDGRLEQMAYYCEQMLDNIAKVNNVYYDSVADAYTAALPDNLIKWKGLKKVGGKTIVFNQLCGDIGTSTVITKVADGVYSIADDTYSSQNAVDFYKSDGTKVYPISGHKYYVCTSHTGTATPATGDYRIYNNYGIMHAGDGSAIYTVTGSDPLKLRVYERTYADYVVYVKVIDLTLLFGSGNEPATAAEVDAMFPAQTYDYNKGTLLSAGVTEVVSKDSNNDTLQTYSIPEEITTAEGYGWSCPGAYNYIDFTTKKFVQAVGSRAYEAGDESDSTVITDGTNTHYALDEPLAFDIEVPDSVITKAEAGGSITFENQHDGDYNIPVPVQMEYIGV